MFEAKRRFLGNGKSRQGQKPIFLDSQVIINFLLIVLNAFSRSSDIMDRNGVGSPLFQELLKCSSIFF